jgi:hypothetical protein
LTSTSQPGDLLALLQCFGQPAQQNDQLQSGQAHGQPGRPVVEFAGLASSNGQVGADGWAEEEGQREGGAHHGRKENEKNVSDVPMMCLSLLKIN